MEVQGCSPRHCPGFMDENKYSGSMAGRVNYKAVIPGESSPRMAQDPGRPSLSVSNQDSRLAEGTSDVGAG